MRPNALSWPALAASLALLAHAGCPTDTDDDDTSGDDDSSPADDDTSGDDDSTGGVDEDGDGWTVGEGDCDDTDPGIHPGQAEATCDGVDNDCDPATEDEPDDDGDGYSVCLDCDDLNPAIHPGAIEDCAGGVDDDCDGGVDDLDVDCGCAVVSAYIGNINITTEAAAQAFCAQYNTVYGSVTVDGTALTDVDDLACLCEVSSALTLDQAPNLERIEFPLLHTVGGDLLLVDGNELIDEILLPNLSWVGGDLVMLIYIPGAPVALSHLELHNLRYLGGEMQMMNLAVTTLEFPVLREAGGIWIFDVDYANPISFPVLETVTSDVWLVPIATEALIEAPVLTSVGGGFTLAIYYPGKVGFPQLEVVTGLCQIHAQYPPGATFPSLRECGELSLTNLVVEDGFVLPSLEVVHGDMYFHKDSNPAPPLTFTFPVLQEIEGTLEIEGAGPAPDFDQISLIEMPALTNVAEDLVVEWSMAMTSTPWGALETIGGDLYLYENEVLEDITELFGLQSIGGNLIIGYNASLPTAHAWALSDTIGAGNIGGYSSIVNNAP